MKAIQSGDLETFKSLLAADPSLATTRSTRSHPTLLQCLVLDGKDKPNAVEMAKVLIDAGADRSIKDTKVGSTPAGWAEHGGHNDLLDVL
jgi:hypothetical protein